MNESLDVQELFGAHYELPELGKQEIEVPARF